MSLFDNTKCYNTSAQNNKVSLSLNNEEIWSKSYEGTGSASWNPDTPSDCSVFNQKLAKSVAIESIKSLAFKDAIDVFYKKSVGNMFIIPTKFIAILIDKYYPLYQTPDDAIFNSPKQSYSEHIINEKTYYMPDGVKKWYGNYTQQPTLKSYNKGCTDCNDCLLIYPDLNNWESNWNIRLHSDYGISNCKWTVKASNRYEIINEKYVIQLRICNMKGCTSCNLFEDKFIISCY